MTETESPSSSYAKVDRMTRLNAALTAGGGAMVYCHSYPDQTPILAVSQGPVTLSVTVAPRAVSADALAFAREFAAAAAVFLAECERFAATSADTAETESAGSAETAKAA